MAAPHHSPESAPDVVGRLDLDNHAIAASLRLALFDDADPDNAFFSPPLSDTVTPGDTSPVPAQLPPPSSSVALLADAAPRIDWKRMHAERALQMAHQREYTAKEGQGKRSHDDRGHDGRYDDGKTKYRKKGGQGNVFLALDRQVKDDEASEGNEGEKRLQDDGWGSKRFSMLGAQVAGVGVIGNGVGSTRAVDLTSARSGYDIDLCLVMEKHDWRLRLIAPDSDSEAPSKYRYSIGPHVISFEPGLSVLSKEHPARVWNSLLHSLKEGDRPKVVFEYEPVMTEEGDDAYMCKMSITSARTKQPELGTGADQQGDAKAGQRVEGNMTIWSGEACFSKSEACNSAIRKALLEGVYGWIMTGQLVLTNEVVEDLLPPVVIADTPGERGAEAGQSTAVPSAGDEMVDAAGTGSHSSASDQLLTLCRAANEELHRSQRSLMFTCYHEFVSNSVDIALHIGLGEHTQVYRSSGHIGLEASLLAVAAKAIECNVAGFLHWLVHNLPSSATDSGQTMQKEQETDWIAQLNHFCRQNDMRQPRVSQEICRREDGDAELAEGEQVAATFRGKIVLDDEEYLDETTFATVSDARQSIARAVFLDYFGQTPVRIAKHDEGYRGRGRGRGRGGRRGRF